GADRLASPAGRAFAAWVDREPADPEIRVEEVPLHQGTARLATVGAGLPDEVADRRQPRERARVVQYGWPGQQFALWPMVLPSHREVAAAYLSPQMAIRDTGNLGTTTLAGLAAADGPHGPAMGLVLAYTLGNHRNEVRIAAADALLTLAARPGFDGAAVGVHVAALAVDGRLKLNRIVAPLTEAMRGGAHRAVAEVTAACLPALQAGRARPGLKDLVRLDETARDRAVSIDR
ncbi:MAG TPA: hypothetical protein VL738_37125, partial [Dactylosporangium sp.]|nr:hypothetical protein [Dactylosporangium sp.]